MNILYGFLVFVIWCWLANLFGYHHWSVLVVGLIVWIIVARVLGRETNYSSSDSGPIDKR